MRNTFLAVLLLLGALTAAAQDVRSTLSGRIVDQSGLAIPGAAVVATNTETNQSRSVRANASGEYVVPELAPGPYSLSVQHEGMQRATVKSIVLETGQDFHVDVTLKVGAVSESVEVEASAPLVNADSSSVGGVVENRKIAELPLNGRNYGQLAVLQPNVIPASQNSSNATRGGLNVAGGSEVSNVYLEDGISNNSASAGSNFTPILDTLREFKVLTGTYAAEYGRMSGAQIIVATRSGTNDYHDSAWEFLRNSVFDARNFFAQSKPSFKRNQPGAVLGGPIKKNRTFFSWDMSPSGMVSRKRRWCLFLRWLFAMEISARFPPRSKTPWLRMRRFRATRFPSANGVRPAAPCWRCILVRTFRVRAIIR